MQPLEINIYTFENPLKMCCGDQDQCSYYALGSMSYSDGHFLIAHNYFLPKSANNVCLVTNNSFNY